MTDDLDEALDLVPTKRSAAAAAVRSAWSATPPRCCRSWSRRGVVPDVVTDQTSAHDPLNGYVPLGMTLEEAVDAARSDDPTEYVRRAPRSMARPRAGHARPAEAAAPMAFDYGNNLRGAGDARPASPTPSTIPGFVPAYIRPLFCEGKGPFRWVALSGDPEDIYRTDHAVLETLPRERDRWRAGSRMAAREGAVPGAARAHLLAGLRRAGEDGPALQRAGAQRRGQGADRHRPRPPRRRLGGLAQPRDRGDERRLATPSPTGRSSTRCSTRPAAPAGSASTTAAASASATACTPAWSSSPTARRRGRRAWSACSRPTRAWASCATPTPATRRRSRRRSGDGLDLPMVTGESA